MLRALRHVGQLARHTLRKFADDNCTQMAAAISYYVLFSLFPLVILAIAVLGLVLRDGDIQHDLVAELTGLLPVDAGGARNVENAVRELTGPSSGALGVLGLAGMVWTASAMFGVIRRSLDVAFDLSGKRPFVRQKLVDFGMLAMLGTLFLLSLGATAALRVTRSAIEEAPVLGGIARELGFGWAVASFLAPTAISFAAFALLYWLVPARHVRLRHVWPGALVAAVLFETVKLAFGAYIQSFTRYDLVFGSLGAVVTFLFLMFVSANVLLLGAELAAQYPRVMRGDYDDPDREPEPPRDAIRRLLRGLFVPNEDERRDAEREG